MIQVKNQKKTKIIYSMQLCSFLLQNGLEYIEVIQHPFKKGFKAWVFEDTQELKDLMREYSKNEGE